MEDISLHILDIAENSVRAGAKVIKISIEKETKTDLLTVTIKDDGSGMDEVEVGKAVNPFFTKKISGKIGLGLPLLDEAAKMADGKLIIASDRNIGTTVTATFRWSHIDRKPIGKIADTYVVLTGSYPDVEFEMYLKKDEKYFEIKTKEIKSILKEKKINSAAYLNFIKKYVEENSENFFK